VEMPAWEAWHRTAAALMEPVFATATEYSSLSEREIGGHVPRYLFCGPATGRLAPGPGMAVCPLSYG